MRTLGDNPLAVSNPPKPAIIPQGEHIRVSDVEGVEAKILGSEVFQVDFIPYFMDFADAGVIYVYSNTPAVDVT